MKKTIILISTIIALLIFQGSSFAEMKPEAPQSSGETGKEVTPDKFNETKSRILRILDERMKRLKEERTCVEAAKNAEELRKCKPERPERPMLRRPEQDTMPEHPMDKPGK